MTEIGKLRDQHSELVRIVHRLTDLIARPTAPPQLQLFDLRRELASTLIGHLKTEDWVLYPSLLASPDAHVASTARSFSHEMGGLAAAFIDYSEKWNATAIAADWPAYCRDSRIVLDALTTRITRENRELYPLLEKLDCAA
ncbi:MAG TPA: hemerythrin domain-containing protein [Sphingomicrobium sp.]|nr:hemerythrin domain-containing protein [Sphingomicrobium sp.]